MLPNESPVKGLSSSGSSTGAVNTIFQKKKKLDSFGLDFPHLYCIPVIMEMMCQAVSPEEATWKPSSSGRQEEMLLTTAVHTVYVNNSGSRLGRVLFRFLWVSP